MTAVGVLHPGAMGAAVGRALVEAGHEVLWSSPGRSASTRRRADDAGLVDAGPIEALRARCEVLLSVCPPDAALDVARAAAGFDGPVIDANAVSPATAADLAAIVGPGYVDGGIVGPPPDRPGTTRLFLSGPGAGAAAALFGTGRPEPVVLTDGGPWAASALKMTYAAWTKGTAALLLAVEQVAVDAGVDTALHDEWARSQPDLPGRLDAARVAADEKGWRWVGEMHEIARTFAAAGAPGGFGEAAADVYANVDPGTDAGTAGGPGTTP